MTDTISNGDSTGSANVAMLREHIAMESEGEIPERAETPLRDMSDTELMGTAVHDPDAHERRRAIMLIRARDAAARWRRQAKRSDEMEFSTNILTVPVDIVYAIVGGGNGAFPMFRRASIDGTDISAWAERIDFGTELAAHFEAGELT